MLQDFANHRLQKEADDEDDGEGSKDGQQEGYESIRLFVCVNIRNFEGRDEFHEKFAENVNEFFTEVLKLEPGAKMVPWKDKTCNLTKAKTAISAEPNSYKKYLLMTMKYAVKGKKYIRMHVAFPLNGDIQYVLDCIKDSSDWYEEDNHYAQVSPCQGTVPVTIGWYSRSLESMTLSNELQDILRQMVSDPSLGLIWKNIDKSSDNRKSLAGTTQFQQQAKKKKGGKNTWERPVKAVHIEVDEENEDRTARKIIKLYNNNDDNSFPLGYSLYFVQALRFRAMRTFEGRQGYLKAWTHQKSLLEFLYSEFCNIINIDKFIPAAVGVGHVTFRKFLTDLKITATPGVEGDRLFLAISRTSPDGMTFCFTYHALAMNEAEEVIDNLPLLYEHEFGGNPSDFFEYDLRCQFTGYKWNSEFRQASSPDGAALFAYGSAICENREENELTIDNINPLELVTYKRLQGDCDETVLNGKDNSGARAKELRNKKKEVASPPAEVKTVEQADDDQSEAPSGVSDLTSTGSGITDNNSAMRLSIHSNGSVGTSKSRVATAVKKAKKKAAQATKALVAAKDLELENMRILLEAATTGDNPQATIKTNTPASPSTPIAAPLQHTILLNKNTTGEKVTHSGSKLAWDPIFVAEQAAKEATKTASKLVQKAKELKSLREDQAKKAVGTTEGDKALTLPPLPDDSALTINPHTSTFFPCLCSFCGIAMTSYRCATILPTLEPHKVLEGEARCARAFCPSCSTSLVRVQIVETQRAITCPFHLMQGLQSSLMRAALVSASTTSSSISDVPKPPVCEDTGELGLGSEGATIL